MSRRLKDMALLGKDVAMLRGLANKLVEGRRTFLIPQTAVSATVIAGLLVFMTSTKDYDPRLVAGAALFALHVLMLHMYMTALLSLEGRKLDHELKLFERIKKEYVDMTDQDISALMRDERTKLKYTYKALEFCSREKWFIAVNILFVFAFLWLLFVFLCRIATPI